MENDENTELFLFVDKVGVCGGVWGSTRTFLKKC